MPSAAATKQYKDWMIEWVRRPRARSVSIQLRPLKPIRVVSARGVPWFFVERFLQEKEDWIRQSLEKFQDYAEKNPPRKLESHEKYLFLGEELQLKYLPTTLKSVFFSRTEKELRLHLPEVEFRNLQETELSRYLPLLKKFYRREAEKFLRERIEIWAHEMNLKFQKLSFRNQKTRWGSCSSRGHISINWKLISTPLSVIDSVLIHELAHLEHLNHSAKFWAVVEKFCPEHKSADRWLRKNYAAMEWLSA